MENVSTFSEQPRSGSETRSHSGETSGHLSALTVNLSPIYSVITLSGGRLLHLCSISFPPLPRTLVFLFYIRDTEITLVSIDCCRAPLPDKLGNLTDGL